MRIPTLMFPSKHLFAALMLPFLALLQGCGGGTSTSQNSVELPKSFFTAKSEPGESQTGDAARLVAVTTLAANSAGNRQIVGVSLDQIFAYAEANYPQFFPQASTTVSSGIFTYRYYSDTGIFLGIDSDTDSLWLYQPAVNPSNLVNLGPASALAGFVQSWVNSYGASAEAMEAFMLDLRTGINTTLDITELRAQESEVRLARYALDATQGGLDVLSDVISECDVDPDTGLLACQGRNFSALDSGGYRFAVSDQGYLVEGTVFLSLDNAGTLVASIEASRSLNSRKLNDFSLRVNAAGLAEESPAVTLNISSLQVRAYDLNSSSGHYVSLDLSGLQISLSELEATGSVAVPVRLKSSEGDEVLAEIYGVQLRRLVDSTGEEYWEPVSLGLRFNITQATGTLLGVDLLATVKNLGTGYLPWLDDSNTNYPQVELSGTLTMANATKVNLVLNDMGRSQTLALAYEQGSRRLTVVGTATRPSVFEDYQLDASGLSISSNGPYRAVLKENASGDLTGEVFENGAKIGVITSNGMIQVGGREISAF